MLFALFQVLCQGQPWHQFAGCLAGMLRFLVGKGAFQGQPRGQSVEMVAWCQPGMQVECLVTWSDAQPPAHRSLRPHPLLPAVEGVLRHLLHLSRQGVGGPQTLLCLRAVITSAFKFYQVGAEPETCVLFPGQGARGQSQRERQ